MTAAHPAPCDAATAQAARPDAGGAAHPAATLGACILGSSLSFIDGSVVNVALPSIAHSLGAGPADLSWTINAYLLPLGALILLGGGAGDRFGRRRLFQLGVAVFLVASVVSAVAPTLAWLLAGRFLQGVGAALLMPNSLAILGASFTGESRGRAIGLWAAVGAIAGAVGPLLGGWLVDAVGWRSIFLINLPVGLGAMALAQTYVKESHDGREGGHLDWAGAAAATLALALLTYALTAATQPHHDTTQVALATAAGAALAVGFLVIERRRGDAALMPFALFGTAAFAGLTLLTFFLYAALGGLIVMLPYVLIRAAGWSAVGAGAAMLPIPILIGLGSRLMGGVAARLGGKWPLGLGAATVAVGLLLYMRVPVEHVDYWRHVLPATLVIGCGMAVSVAPLTTSVIASVDADHVGAASGFNSAVARVGGLIATALLGFVFAAQGSRDAFMHGVHLAAAVGAAMAATASVGALLLVPGRPKAPAAA